MNSKYLQVIVVTVIMTVILVIIGGLWLSPKKEEAKPISAFDLNPSPSVLPTPQQEPVIVQWEPYENAEYKFAFDYPKDWKKEDYSGSFLSGGTRVAFSPDVLPCQTCTYIDEGYFSVKIFNSETSPKDYAEFQQKIAALGKSKEVIPIQLNGQKGILFGNSAAVEHGGWVYDFRLDVLSRTGDPKIKENILGSKIFMRALTSFKFTDLLFNM